MTRNDLIKALFDDNQIGTLRVADPEIKLWISETETATILSIYTAENDKDIAIDIQID